MSQIPQVCESIDQSCVMSEYHPRGHYHSQLDVDWECFVVSVLVSSLVSGLVSV